MLNQMQEAESIRLGFDYIDRQSIRALREIAASQLNGNPVSNETMQRLIVLEADAHELRVRMAILEGREPPERPEWLDPVEVAAEGSPAVE